MCEVYFKLYDKRVRIMSDNDLPTNRWQAIIWINGGLGYWRVSLGDLIRLDILSQKYPYNTVKCFVHSSHQYRLRHTKRSDTLTLTAKNLI